GDDTLVIVAHGGTQMAVLHTYAQPPRAETAWCGKNGGGFLLSVSADEWQRTHTLCLVQEVCYAQ
ncbi:MAG: histidine phosphatase family protein, partial [Oscillospiraceae bacterium]|nr:histidine phosphatase family protein [Oscillospiraceae bacterium]